VKHKILLQHLGENATTSPDPVAAVLSQDGDLVTAQTSGGNSFTVNLQEKHTCCMNSGWGMLTTVDKYAVAEVELPDWMSCAEYLRHQVEFKYYLGFGGQLTWPRQWFFRLVNLGEFARYAAIKLLNVGKFRSPFRMSLRSQLEAWLNDPNPKYQNPFSPRQWEALLDGHTCLAARRTATNLYWTR
jgi:hypothetical protein